MDWLLFAFALELGAIRGNDLPVDVASYVQMESAVTLFRHVEIGGTFRSYQVPSDDYRWTPFRIDYTTGVTLRFGILSFGVEHECFHNVWSPNPIEGYRLKQSPRWAAEKAFIRIATPR
jgi:hypothetical protein